MIIALLLCDTFLELLIKLVDGIGLILALVTHGTAAVCLVFVNDKKIAVLINTKSLWLFGIDTDEKSRYTLRW